MKSYLALTFCLAALLSLQVLICGAAPLKLESSNLENLDGLVARGTMDWEDWMSCFGDTCLPRADQVRLVKNADKIIANHTLFFPEF